jgi:hypothetical protein
VSAKMTALALAMFDFTSGPFLGEMREAAK